MAVLMLILYKIVKIGDEVGNVCYATVMHANDCNSEACTMSVLVFFHIGFCQYHTLVTSLVESGWSLSVLLCC